MRVHVSATALWRRLAIPLIAVAVAVALRAGPLSVLGARAPYLTFSPAIIVAALYGGMYSGFLATALASIAATYWMEPRGQFFVIRDSTDALGLAVFAISGVMVSIVCEAMHRARDKAREAEAKLAVAVERQRAEEAIERYELLSRHCRDIILFVRKEDGRILECNEAAETAYGRTRDDLLSLTVHDIRMPGDRMLTEWQMDVADTSGALFETIHRRKDGSTFPVEVSSSGSTIGGERCMLSVIRDITKRKQAEDARRETEANTRAILDAASESIWLFSPEGVILSANETAAQRLHLTPAEVIGSQFSDLLTPELADQRLLQMKAVVDTRQPVQHIDERDAFTFQHTFYPVYDDSGEVIRIAVFSRDITESQRAEDALRESEARLARAVQSLETVMETAPAAICVAYDVKCEHIFGNARAHEMLGVPTSRNISVTAGGGTPAPYTVLRDGKEVAGEDLPMQHAARTGEAVHEEEWEIVRQDGSKITILMSASPLYAEDGGAVGAVGTFLDITDRKVAEEALRESEQRLRFHLENSPLAVVEWDAGYYVTQWSWEAERIFGWSAEEVIGSRIDTLNLIYRDDISIVERTMDRLSGGVERTVVSSNRNYTKSREVIECTWYNSVLLDDDGRMKSVMSLVEDITERKRAEEALRATNEELALFNAAMVGRELRMIELKNEINSLCAGVGQAPRYEVDCEEEQP